MNRYQEALNLLKMQLGKTDQNLKAFKTLQELVDLVNIMDGVEEGTVKTYTLEEAMEELDLEAMGTEANHLRNFFTDDEDDPKIDK
jgi:hypothetical protein